VFKIRVSAPQSPCTGVCQLDWRSVCRGCGRTIEEIAEWGAASEARRHQIVAAAKARHSGLDPRLRGGDKAG